MELKLCFKKGIILAFMLFIIALLGIVHDIIVERIKEGENE